MVDPPPTAPRIDSEGDKDRSERSRRGPHGGPPVCIIATVLDDVAGLRVMLDSLSRQTRPADEIVVADRRAGHGDQ